MIFSIPHKNSSVRSNPVELHLKAASSQLGAGPLEHDSSKFSWNCHIPVSTLSRSFCLVLSWGRRKGWRETTRKAMLVSWQRMGFLVTDSSLELGVGVRPGSVSSDVAGAATVQSLCSGDSVIRSGLQHQGCVPQLSRESPGEP